MNDALAPRPLQLLRAPGAGLLGLVLVIGSERLPRAEEPQVTVLRCGQVLGLRSGNVLRNRNIVAEGGRIAAGGSASSVMIPPGAKVIDLGQATLLPSLIDCHKHLIDLPEDSGDTAYALKKSATRQFATHIEHGMTPLAAVQSATIHAAELLAWADRAGSMEPGK